MLPGKHAYLMRKNQLGVVHIALVIIILAIVGIIGFSFLKRSQDSETFKTYKNENLGFQFNYDKSSTIYYEGNNKADGGIFALTLQDPSFSEGKEYKDDELYFDLDVVEKGTHWLPTHCEVINDTKNVFDELETAKIVKKDGAYNQHYLSYCVERGDRVYLFNSSYSLSLGNGEKIEKLFTQILSSFSFL